MISHFLNVFEKENRRKIGISPDAVEAMKSYGWPGNVRELENLIKRLATLSDGETIDADELPSQFPRSKPSASKPRKIVPLEKFIAGQTEAYMKEVISQEDGDLEKAASIIGISPSELKKKIKAIKTKKLKKEKTPRDSHASD